VKAAVQQQEVNMRKSVSNNQIRALAMAMAGATLAAVSTMFVPVAVLEGITGSTGLSELIPAARAPLGDTARALIAFGAGAFTLAILAFALVRQDGGTAPKNTRSVPVSEWAADVEAISIKDRLARIHLPSLPLPKMPWAKGEDDITDLADLPRLRNGDSHPDAPPRRPLVASQDLPVLDLAQVPEAMAEASPEVVDAPAETEVASASEFPHEPPAPVATANVEPTLAQMVAQLEAAVAERQKQLAELEAVATELAANSSAVEPIIAQTAEQSDVEIIDQSEISVEPARVERPPLEAVPSLSVKDDDIDSALAAALATLQRMNATGR
jgi:hypothetical protein